VTESWPCARSILHRASTDEIIIDVRYSGVCGSDIPKLRRPELFSLPERWRPGPELVGTDPSGAWVAIDPLRPCDRCPSCARGDIHLCADLERLGWDLPGGFAEQVSVAADQLHSLPADIDPIVPTLADPAAVAIHGLRCAPAGPGKRLAVIGAGAVGMLTALYAESRGWEVTVVHRNGIDIQIPANIQQIQVRAQRDASGTRFDVVIDAASGSLADPVELALELVVDGGMVVVQNAYDPGLTLPTPMRDVFRRSIRLVGSFSYCRRQNNSDFKTALDFLRAYSDRARHLVAAVGGLADLPTAVAGQGQPRRRVLQPQRS
jgi:threonine dehydrogenase-like Zn-dependent dehydrogenase